MAKSETSESVGWTVREYMGAEVYRPPAGLTLAEVRDKANWPKDFEPSPIREPKLKVGDLLLVPSPFGGMYIGAIRASPQGDPYFQSSGGSLIGALEYDIDDRHCWTCGGLGNLDAIKRLELK